MSNPSPFGEGNEELFRSLFKFFASPEKMNWDLATQVAQESAQGGAPIVNVDPLVRVKLEELMKVADLHVSTASGLTTSTSANGPVITCLTRPEWAARTLSDWRPLLEALSESMGKANLSGAFGDEVEEAGAGPQDLFGAVPGGLGQIFGKAMQALPPLLFSIQIGAAIGQLSIASLAQYDLPVPRPPSDQILFVPENIGNFASDWSLPPDDLILWLCIRELSIHSLMRIDHVRDEADRLLTTFAGGYTPSAQFLEEKLGNIDPASLQSVESIQDLLGDPSTLLDEMLTSEQRSISEELSALMAVVMGWSDHMVDQVGSKLVSSYGALSEAMKRRRVERSDSEHFIDRLFGLEMSQAQFDRGDNFIKGVIDREGEEALLKIWADKSNLPTPAEVDAPGLWLERIKLPAD